MTRTLILSDIHGNKDALDAVVADAGNAERIWCLGDIVGYGPEPGACVAWVRAHCDIVLSGNHDYAAFDPSVVRDFNPNAALAAEWTRDQLTDEQVTYLQSLPSLVEVNGVTLAHASPTDPIWTYILSVVDARDAFGAFSGACCFVGHTHVAACYAEVDGMIVRIPTVNHEPYPVADGRFILNPGSVGQPRDRDPNAAYLWYDDDAYTVEWKRVAYDIAAVQEKMRSAGLPDRLAARLALGQ
ncbi:MAG: metallophosphatase family protein [Chloroflexota bacterium]|nr:metallophosphatase family protein [Chloroflexota bacterium]